MVSINDSVILGKRSTVAVLCGVWLVLVVGSSRAAEGDAAVDPAGAEFFEKKIRPVFEEICFQCHSARAEKIKGGLRLDTAEGLRKGGESGPVIVPGKPEESRLIRAIRYLDNDLQMPPKKRLADSVVKDFERWVETGAVDPRGGGGIAKPQAAGEGIDYERGREFWSLRPVRAAPPPGVRDGAWVQSPVDRFILEKLEAAGLKPAAPADKRTLIRRATFDLIGLPPTPGEVRDFLADESPNAFEKVIDRLLASSHYGQRWGRHWLDIVRYADSKDARSSETAADLTHAWRYRDWVVDALNRDYPYDQFLTDQIAGDILSARSPTGLDFPKLIATGMLALGAWEYGDSDKRKMMSDIVDDQIDVIGRGVMGLTLACARCHDHKFDPIAQRDYYAMAGFFFSSHVIPEPGNPAAGTPMLAIAAMTTAQRGQRQQIEVRAAELQKQVTEKTDSARERFADALRRRTADYLTAVYDLRPSAAGEKPAMETLAAERGLDAMMLRRWTGYLGLPMDGEPHVAGLFDTRFDDVAGQKGLPGWRGAGADLPSLTVNPGDVPRRVLTFTLPPRSVCVHPSPDKPVAVGWRSPISGRVAIGGNVADGDGACGNGFAWTLERRHGGVRESLATGVVENAGTRELTGIAPVEVAVGDVVSILIDPRDRDHSCDTTTVSLKIVEQDGERRVWDLAGDVVGDVHAGNPHADSLGHAGVWHFYTSSAIGPAVPPESALGRWRGAMRGGAGRGELQPLADLVRDAVMAEASPGAPGDADLHKALRAADGYFLRDSVPAASLPAEQRAELDAMNRDLAAARAKLAEPVTLVNGIQEGGVPTSEHEKIRDARIHIRGRYDRLGDVVPRGFPRVIQNVERGVGNGERGTGNAELPEKTDFVPSSQFPVPSLETSGRVELARWIADPGNPLTARVMVNRIWQHHFGRGIVPTADNFGKLGQAPSHPELLDYLAVRFTRSGGSIKAMHRIIMLSATYRQGCGGAAATLAADPDNKLLGRMNRRRLEVEPLRDAMLAVAGTLNTAPGGPSIPNMLSPRRTLYIRTVRSDNSTFRQLFDGADSSAIITHRNESTVAPQSLFMMNSPFVLAQSGTLAERVRREEASHDRGRIAKLYEWLYARPPTEAEIETGLSLLGGADDAAAWQAYCQVLLCANEFVYVD